MEARRGCGAGKQTLISVEHNVQLASRRRLRYVPGMDDHSLLDVLRSLERQIANLHVMAAQNFHAMGKHMAQIDDDIAILTADVAALTTVAASAETLLTGIADLVATAVSKALGAGATADQLAGVTAVHDALTKQTAGLAAAVAAATPAAYTHL